MAEEPEMTLTRLPGAVRSRVLALAAGVLPDVADPPPALRKVAGFAPARRARAGAAQLTSALEGDDDFRRQVGTLVEASLPAESTDADLAAALWLRREYADLAAALERLGRDTGTARAAEAEVDRLRRRVASLQGESRELREAQRQQLAGLKEENADLRRRLGATRAELRAARAAAEEATARAEAAEQARSSVSRERDAEVRRLRARVSELQAGLERARGESRGQREDATLRARLLLDTLIDAAAGLRRELALPVATGSPAARVEEELAARSGARAAAGPTRPGDSRVLEQVLALPRARLLIDGYNVSRSVWESSSLEAQRARLVRALGPLVARTGAETTVVFDAAHAEVRPVVAGAPRGVTVLFSPPGVLADDVIGELVDAEPPGRPVVVVSSDQEVAEAAVRSGARAVASAALLELLGV